MNIIEILSRFIKRFIPNIGKKTLVLKPENRVNSASPDKPKPAPKLILDKPVGGLGGKGPSLLRETKFQLGAKVRHRLYPFRGVIYDVDPEFASSEEWYNSIPEETRPRKDQPFYHLLAENDQSHYEAYVAEQNLIPDESDDPVEHPDILEIFDEHEKGYILKPRAAH